VAASRAKAPLKAIGTAISRRMTCPGQQRALRRADRGTRHQARQHQVTRPPAAAVIGSSSEPTMPIARLLAGLR
jgi:hypothetical protein